tara:strand:+ start:1791 stop:2129 length:339 start_codon:yes stop_codon:yes gene_type:complete
MPLPTPEKDEKEADFMKRCMPISSKESKDSKQAVAICMSQFRQKKSKGLLGEADEAYRSAKYIEEAVNKNKSSASTFIYKDPKTGELYHYSRKGFYKKDGRILVFVRESKGK